MVTIQVAMLCSGNEQALIGLQRSVAKDIYWRRVSFVLGQAMQAGAMAEGLTSNSSFDTCHEV